MSTVGSARWRLMLLALMVAAPDTGAQAASGPAVTEEDLKKESREALETARQYTAQQKEAFHRRMQGELDEMERKIEGLKREAERASETARREAEKHIRELERETARAETRLKELEAAGGEAWEELKSGLNAALKDLQRSYDRARSRRP